MIHALIHWDEPDGGLGTYEVGKARTVDGLRSSLTSLLDRFRRQQKHNLRFQIFDDLTARVIIRGRMKS